jgi:glycosyltransferase involved in cell wall biosynthesis
MHICFITGEYPMPGFPHGGIGTFVRTLGTALVEAGHSVTVVGIAKVSADEYWNDNGVRIYRLSSAKIKGLTWIINAIRLNSKVRSIDKKDPIHIIETSEAGLAFICKRKRTGYVVRLHGGHCFFAEAEHRGIDPWKAFQERRSVKKADIITGVGKYVMDHTADYLDYGHKRGPVIYNPVDTTRFYKADSKKKIKGFILFAGTVTEKKGIRQLVEAIQLVAGKYPDTHLYVAGRDGRLPDGRSYTAYLKQFISVDDAKEITFLGSVSNDEIPRLMEQAEVCVFPSHLETFGLVAVEAMAMGKPVVFSKRGPGPEIIEHGVTGLLCDPYDPKDIAEKILTIMDNPQLGISLGEAAIKAVSERFSVTNLVLQNISLYKSLLKS